jgi:hypothetical protein
MVNYQVMGEESRWQELIIDQIGRGRGQFKINVLNVRSELPQIGSKLPPAHGYSTRNVGAASAANVQKIIGSSVGYYYQNSIAAFVVIAA